MITGTDYLKEWQPGDDIGIIFDDLLKEARPKEKINQLFIDLHNAAKSAGFDMKMWGLRKTFEQSVEKTLAKDKSDMLEFIERWHANACIETGGKIRKMHEGSIGWKAQEILLRHNIISKGEDETLILTADKK